MINLKSKKKQYIVCVLFLLVLFFVGNYYLANPINNKVNHGINSYTLTNVDILRTSGHWNLAPFVIGDSGGGDYTWEEASAETWCSGSGTFEEPYLIENVTIDGGNSGNCIEIKNSDKYFRIENCTFFNSGLAGFAAGIRLNNVGNGTLIDNNCSNNNFAGIYLGNSDNTTVSGNTVNDNSYGILLQSHSDNNNISGNTANNTDSGIYLDGSDNTDVSGNTANNNTRSGIRLSYSDNTTISGNTANNNGIAGIRLSYSDNNIVCGNTVSNNTNYAGIHLSYSDNNTVSGNTANDNRRGIHLSDDSDNNTISGNTANNNSIAGIILYDSSDKNTVCGNTVSNNTRSGIDLSYTDNNTISGNTVNNNQDDGIVLSVSDNNTVCGNTVSNNTNFGIHLLDHSDNNTISGNTVNNNQDNGIVLSVSDNNFICGNTVSNNTNFGIILYDSSDNNTVSGNNVDNNVNFGIIIESSDYNRIYKNYFNDNNINAYDDGTDNKWDNGIIGNYWDDYAGVDANDDGIGDIPYIISGPAGNQDNFPIWADGDDVPPVITIISPLVDSLFSLDAPNYNISIEDLNLDTIWYTFDGGITNYTFTSLTSTFNQLAWGALSEGSVTIRFYANDTAGHIGSAAVTVEKDVSAPDITIIFHLPVSVFDLVAPNYNISIEELNLDTIWYTLDGGITNYAVTDLTGTFNQLAWGALSEGNVTIRFYANDTAGNTGLIDVEVIIEIPEDEEESPIISFGNYYILFMFIAITILSFIILEKRKKK